MSVSQRFYWNSFFGNLFFSRIIMRIYTKVGIFLKLVIFYLLLGSSFSYKELIKKFYYYLSFWMSDSQFNKSLLPWMWKVKVNILNKTFISTMWSFVWNNFDFITVPFITRIKTIDFRRNLHVVGTLHEIGREIVKRNGYYHFTCDS